MQRGRKNGVIRSFTGADLNWRLEGDKGMDANIGVILALVGAAVAAGITVAVRIVMKKKDSSTRTKQSDNIVFGDQAGRDIKK